MAWPALDPGRLLERCGDVAPRRMTVHDRTRLTGRLRHLRSGVRPSRRCPRFVPPLAVQNAGPAPGIPNPCGCSLPSSGVRPKKTPTLRTAGGGTNRRPRSGHATPLRLSPRPLDSRGLALGCTAGASGRLPSMKLLSMELLGNDCCFVLPVCGGGRAGPDLFCLPPLAGEGARRADGGSAGMRGGSHPHPALRATFSHGREKGGWAVCICPAYGSDAWARPFVSCLIVPPRSNGVSKSPAASRPGRCRSGRSAVRG